jgi:hypothetical protein
MQRAWVMGMSLVCLCIGGIAAGLVPPVSAVSQLRLKWAQKGSVTLRVRAG